jgi:WD40 repeat protein
MNPTGPRLAANDRTPETPENRMFSRPVFPMTTLMLAALLFASSPTASAGLFGASKNDVAVKVAELSNLGSEIYPLGLDFSPDGNRVAVESVTEKIYIWDWRNKRVESTVEKPHGGNSLGSTNPIQYSPDGRHLAVCEVSGVGDVVVRIWNTDHWSIAKDISAGTGIESRGSCRGMGFTPDGQQFIRTADTGGTPGNSLIVYAVDTWQPIWGLPMPGLTPVSIAISPDGGRAAIAGTFFVVPQGAMSSIDRFQQTRTAAKVNIVDLNQRKIDKTIKTNAMGPLAWSSDGARLAIAGGSVEIFDPRSGQNLVQETIENSGKMNARFTPDGRFFIDSDLNGMGKGLGVNIWDSQHQKLLQHIPVGDVGSIAVSRDGKYLAVGSTGRTTIWQFK